MQRDFGHASTLSESGFIKLFFFFFFRKVAQHCFFWEEFTSSNTSRVVERDLVAIWLIYMIIRIFFFYPGVSVVYECSIMGLLS